MIGDLEAAVVSFPIIVILSVGLHRLARQIVVLLRLQPSPGATQ
jgi:hypothetical protein